MADGASGPGSAASPDGAPGGWRLYSGGHFMRIDGGEHGKLARLADVRDWLMALHEWPMDVAADEVIARLRQAHATGLELFVANPKSYADQLRPDAHMLSREDVEQRGGLLCLDERLLGFEGVCNAILNGWVGEYRGYLSAPRVDAVCVRAAVAHELWGWGSVAGAPTVATSLELEDVETWAQLVEWRLANVNAKNKRGPDWGRGSGKQLRILEAELARLMSVGAGKSAALNAMGRELGYTSAEPRKPMQKAIDAARKRKAAAPSAAPSLDRVTIVHSGQKVPKLPKAA